MEEVWKTVVAHSKLVVEIQQGRVSASEVNWKSSFLNFDEAADYFLKNAPSGDKRRQDALEIADAIRYGAEHIRARENRRRGYVEIANPL